MLLSAKARTQWMGYDRLYCLFYTFFYTTWSKSSKKRNNCFEENALLRLDFDRLLSISSELKWDIWTQFQGIWCGFVQSQVIRCLWLIGTSNPIMSTALLKFLSNYLLDNKQFFKQTPIFRHIGHQQWAKQNKIQ